MVAWVTREFKAVVCPNLEADDVLGLRSGKDTVIVSWDKDMKQIPGKHYNPISDEVFEVSPEEGYRYFLTQVLTGDRVDGYTGLPGCGPVKAENILNASCTWDSVAAAYTRAGLTEQDALRQARLAYILKDPTDYNSHNEVRLWTP
jgi:DNA polymerase-1